MATKHSLPWRQKQVDDQHHAPATLPPGYRRLRFCRRLGGPGKENLAHTGIDPLVLQLVAYLRYPGHCTGVLISPQPDHEGNKLQRQKILIFIYPIYNHNWRNISTIYIYIYKTRLASKEIFSLSNKILREVGRAKDLPALLCLSD